MDWMDKNRSQLASYIGRAKPELKDSEIRHLLLEDEYPK